MSGITLNIKMLSLLGWRDARSLQNRGRLSNLRLSSHSVPPSVNFSQARTSSGIQKDCVCSNSFFNFYYPSPVYKQAPTRNLLPAFYFSIDGFVDPVAYC